MDSAATPTSNQVIRSYMVLRNAIGFIGVCLPFAVFLGNWIIFSHHQLACLVPIGNKLPDSLSGYYYSHMRDVFVGGMCAAGVFLIFYRGDDRWERWLTNLAGFFAVGIALFPTTAPNISPTSSCGPVTPIMPQPAPHGSAIALVHAGCLIGLMAGIAFMALRWARQYTDSQKIAMVREDQEIERDPGLKMRNKRLYYGCVVAMAAAGALALIQEFAFSQQVKAQAPWLFYAEMVAFLAFGVAWFVKGRAIMGFRRSLRTARETLTGAIRRRPSKVSTGT